MYHMIPVLALTSPPIVLFLPYTWYTPCRITNPFLCILIFLLLLDPLYSPSELEDKVSRQRHLLPTSTAMTRKMNRNKTVMFFFKIMVTLQQMNNLAEETGIVMRTSYGQVVVILSAVIIAN